MMTDDTTNIATEEPVVHENLISRRVWYYVFGEWSCLGLDCENKWGHKRTKIKLSKYKDRVDANDLNDTERVGQKCRKCSSNNSKLVKYSPLPEEDIKPPVHEHLIWKHDDKEEWYRVFGTWDCDNENCKPGWSSAHTYILLSKYRDEIPAANLQRDDHYWGQDSNFFLRYKKKYCLDEINRQIFHQICPSTPSGQQFFITFNDNSSNNSNSIPKNNVPRNNDVPKNNVQTPPMIKVNAPFSSTSSTTISVRRIKTPGQNNVIRKQETVSGTQTTHFRKSTHRLELVSSRMRLQQQQLQQLQQQQKQQQKQQQLQQQQQQQQQQQLQQQLHQQQLQQQLHQHQMQQQLQQQQLQHQLQQQLQQQQQQQQQQQKQQQHQQQHQQQQQKLQQQQQKQMTSISQQSVVPKKLYEEFDPKKADLVLLKYTKEMLKKYIEEEPSGILRNGECTWSETEPYIREVHFPKFRKYLNDRGIQAQDIIISKCLKDLHISRRDLWNKKQRKLRELRSKEQFDNVEAQSPRSDGYVPFKRK
ncbi:hypothetical protein GLOIN_2v1470198 [Rhizophagus irregularis DAOM 181602=DAOM 197198]|nr:hypothetical protein GLOIN_2v1470198 [Rhizophagus irregularis DAOM 181602=DAOM 197198]